MVMPLVLVGLLWAIITNRLPSRTWVLALLLQGLLLGAAGVALWSGSQDEERFEDRAGEMSLEAHERAAQAFSVAVAATLALAAVGFVLRERRRPFAVTGGTAVALSLVVLLLGIQAGRRGGLMVHGGVDQTGSRGAEAARSQTPAHDGDADQTGSGGTEAARNQAAEQEEDEDD
jgi:hypothetical protein